ncbi:hypothetical protein [Thalassospira alkalitolerans]|uniref:hypothetical protein n=1 Tax=Thalassospira alkalitolerans TaxID=1293890 RepID=UPI003AA9189A
MVVPAKTLAPGLAVFDVARDQAGVDIRLPVEDFTINADPFACATITIMPGFAFVRSDQSAVPSSSRTVTDRI